MKKIITILFILLLSDLLISKTKKVVLPLKLQWGITADNATKQLKKYGFYGKWKNENDLLTVFDIKGKEGFYNFYYTPFKDRGKSKLCQIKLVYNKKVNPIKIFKKLYGKPEFSKTKNMKNSKDDPREEYQAVSYYWLIGDTYIFVDFVSKIENENIICWEIKPSVTFVSKNLIPDKILKPHINFFLNF